MIIPLRTPERDAYLRRERQRALARQRRLVREGYAKTLPATTGDKTTNAGVITSGVIAAR